MIFIKASDKLYDLLTERNVSLSIALFFVLLISMVVSPLWMRPSSSIYGRLLIMVAVLAFIIIFSVLFYFLLKYNPYKGHENHETTDAKQDVHQHHPQDQHKHWINYTVLMLTIITFLVMTVPHVMDSIQNCGDENPFLQENLAFKSFLQNTFSGTLGITAVILAAIAIICAIILVLSRFHHKMHNLKKWACIILIISLLLFSILTVYLSINAEAHAKVITDDNAFSVLLYSPLALWLRTPFMLILDRYPDAIMRAVALLISLLTIIFIYENFKRFYSASAGLYAAAIYAFSALFLISSTSIYVTNFYVFFAIISTFMFMKYMRTEDKYYLGLAIIYGLISFFVKLEGIILCAVFIATYIVYTYISKILEKKKFETLRSKRFWKNVLINVLLIAMMILPYYVVKYLKKGYNERDLAISMSNVMGFFQPKIFTVYPKTIIEWFTIPVMIIFIIALVYLFIKHRDEFLYLSIISLIVTIFLASLDGPFFIGADYGRFIATCGIFVAGIVAIFISTMIHKYKLGVLHLTLLALIAAYMIFNMYTPLAFEKLHYDSSLLYTYKHRPFEPNSRELPSRELAEMMQVAGIRNSKILSLTYFPQQTYDGILGLNNTYIELRDVYLKVVPAAQQNPQTLLSYVKYYNISYVIFPYIDSTNVIEWWYSCAFISLEQGNNPQFIPQSIVDQKEFKTVFYSSNQNGKMYLLRLGP